MDVILLLKTSRTKIKAIIFCIALSVAAQAQQPTTSTYYFIRPFYAFTGISAKVGEQSATVQGVTFTKGVYGSYGRGLGIQAGIGKMINRNFGFELGGEYFHGSKLRGNYTSDADAFSGTESSKINAAMVKPLLVLRNSGDLLSIYSKLGLAISVWSKRYEKGSLNLSGTPASLFEYEERHKISGKVGFAAAFGLSFRIKEAFAITTEINGQMISLPVREGEYIRYHINGQDQLPGLSVSDKKWTYERSVSSAPFNPAQPSQQLYEPANFSYIGISVGLVHYF